ncbi:ABC transporter ATP-binding protein [Arthrobacter sp. GCM10027362]
MSVRIEDRQTPASITVEDLEVVFPPPTPDDPPAVAVDGVSFEINTGELVVLVGRSGCGKTSVLNVLAGLYKPTSGSVSIVGKPPLAARDHIGYMFARDGLLPWRTARRNVEFALEIRYGRSLSRSERKARAIEYIEKVGVGHALNRYPWQLSNGMRQRVALARTWAIEPDVLFMDEPFAALDAQTRAEVQREFLDVWTRDKKTVVFVTHDLKEAILLADRIIVMRGGKVVDQVSVDIARPRDENMIEEDPAYRSMHHRLIEGLQLDHVPSREI